MKLLKQKYKTYEGARKCAAFENGVARSEYEKGYKAHHYHYTVHAHEGGWRVARWRIADRMIDNSELDDAVADVAEITRQNEIK